MELTLSEDLPHFSPDFDEDCKLGREDLTLVLERITDGSLTEEEKKEFIDQVRKNKLHPCNKSKIH